MASPGPGPDFIDFESGFCSGPTPNFSHFRVQVRISSSNQCPCPRPDCIHFVSGSWSGFYHAFAGPGPCPRPVLQIPRKREYGLETSIDCEYIYCINSFFDMCIITFRGYFKNTVLVAAYVCEKDARSR